VCDPGQTVHIENNTDQTLTVFSNGVGFHELAPGDSANIGVLDFEGERTYELRTPDGTVLASRTFTWDELDRENGISIIVQNEQTAEPSATRE
jgi:hypothetical protein